MEMLTPADVMKILRLGRNKTYDLIASGALPVIRFGRAIRIPRAALEEWIAREAKNGGK